MTARVFVSAIVLAGLCVAARADEPQRAIPLSELRSGATFVTPETRAQQDDLTVNPGMLWVEQGAKLWNAPAGTSAKSCASCHGAQESMKGVAARYPLVDKTSGGLLNIAGRIQQCRTERQVAPPLVDESDDLLSLTTLVAHQSRSVPLAVDITGTARSHFDAGRDLYYTRVGQLNLSCANCHEENWGKRLRNETISQGHPNGFPAYRLEWQTLGSLQRRLKACFNGVRAEPPEPSSDDMRNLELYLAWRAQGLSIEAPGVRR